MNRLERLDAWKWGTVIGGVSFVAGMLFQWQFVTPDVQKENDLMKETNCAVPFGSRAVVDHSFEQIQCIPLVEEDVVVRGPTLNHPVSQVKRKDPAKWWDRLRR